MVYLVISMCFLNFHINDQVIPPGMEFHHIVPHDGEMDGEVEKDEDNPASPDPPIWSEVIIVLSCQSFGL